MITEKEMMEHEGNAEVILRIFELVNNREDLDIEPCIFIADLLHDVHWWCDIRGYEWQSAVDLERVFYDDAMRPT